jgi:Icc-related predicted phosphoesterase
VRILHLSDTHNLHQQIQYLPPADIIIHSGDMSMAGTGKEVMDFINWFTALDYKYKIFIAGNHDYCLEGKQQDVIQSFLPDNCHYLYNSGITIGGVNFWGVPFFFSDDVSGEYANMIAQIPTDTNVLITHRPPYGILDRADNYFNITYGCSDLLQKVLEIKPRYHLFGHIHDAYGTTQNEGVTFINGAVMDGNYVIANNPIVFEITTDRLKNQEKNGRPLQVAPKL